MKLRVELAGVGRAASRFQGCWVLANLLKLIHLNVCQLPNFVALIAALSSVAKQALASRDRVLGGYCQTRYMQIFKRCVDQRLPEVAFFSAMKDQNTRAETNVAGKKLATATGPKSVQVEASQSEHGGLFARGFPPSLPAEDTTSKSIRARNWVAFW